MAALAVLLAAPVYACRGRGVHDMMLANTGIGNLGLIACCVLIALAFYLRSRRVGFSPYTWALLFPIVFSPSLIGDGYGGDCGDGVRDGAYVLVPACALLMLWQVARFVIQIERAPKRSLSWIVPLGLLALAGYVAAERPTDPDPPPQQFSYMDFEYGRSWDNKVVDLMKQKGEEDGVYPGSFAALQRAFPDNWGTRIDLFVDCQGNGDGGFDEIIRLEARRGFHLYKLLQGTTDNPTGWRVEGGLSDWAIVVRPVDFGRPEVFQFIFDSKGGLWRKPDPGKDEFLLDAMPPDPAADGWELVYKEPRYEGP